MYSHINIIVGCEESQAVTIELRSLGFNAFSCDLKPCSGERPEWHIQGDLIEVLKGGNIITQSGEIIVINKWKAGVFFPPCTYMSKAGARWMYPTAGSICQKRLEKGLKAKKFFMDIFNSDIEFISMENPMPLKVIELPKESQIIQPYMFGHPYSKKTYLWLKNLPPLLPTSYVNDFKPYMPSNTGGGQKRSKSNNIKNKQNRFI